MGVFCVFLGFSFFVSCFLAVRPSCCTNWLLGSLSAIEAISVLAPRRSPRLDRPTAGMGCVRTGPSSLIRPWKGLDSALRSSRHTLSFNKSGRTTQYHPPTDLQRLL